MKTTVEKVLVITAFAALCGWALLLSGDLVLRDPSPLTALLFAAAVVVAAVTWDALRRELRRGRWNARHVRR